MALLDDVTTDISGSHVFYDKDSGFAQDATYVSGGSGTLTLIFDNDFIDIETGQVVAQASNPQAWCRTSEAPARDAVLTIGSTNYRVYTLEPNTDGETLLQLVEES